MRTNKPRNIFFPVRLVSCVWVLFAACQRQVVHGFAAVAKARLPQDLPQIRSCRAAAFDKPAGQLLLSQQKFINATSVEEGRTECFVVRGNGQNKAICGTADISFKQKQTVLISNVFVSPESRGQGLAKLMLDAIENEALARGANRLVLEVYTSNIPAFTLYQRYSFSTNGVHAVLAQISKVTGFPFLVEMEKRLA